MWAPSQKRWKEIIGASQMIFWFLPLSARSDHQSDSILASFSTSIVSKYSSTPLARLVHSLRSSSSYMLKSINIFWKLEIIIWWEWKGREKSISNRKAAFVSPLFLMLKNCEESSATFGGISSRAELQNTEVNILIIFCCSVRSVEVSAERPSERD